MSLKCSIGNQNWGDAIAPFIYQSITKKTPHMIHKNQRSKTKNYVTIGSIMRFVDEKSIVWGTGFLSGQDSLGALSWGNNSNDWEGQPKNKVYRKPFQIKAVRGRLTQQKLQSMGVDCPSVYGDPALLFPLFYNPVKSEKKYVLGIIPHYVHKNHLRIKQWEKYDKVKIIDIKQNKFKFIDQMLECKYIISSSLHGLIAADAYRIPNAWFVFQPIKKPYKTPVLDGFKYKDHFSAIGRDVNTQPLILNDNITLDDIIKNIPELTSVFDTKSLLDACPFK